MSSRAEATRREAAYLLLALALATLSLGVYLDLPLLGGIHEARVLETGREMLELGDWLVPHFTGAVRLEKPPLPYWSSALAYLLAGAPSVAAARLVVTALGLLMLLATWSIAHALGERRTALFVLPVMAGFLLFNTEFRKVTTDPFLAALTSAAVAGFAWALRRDGAIGKAGLAVAYLFTALALLAKGPIALVFVGLGAFFVRPRSGRSEGHGWGWHVLGLALACAPLAVWALLIMQQLPDAFALWRYEVMGRVTGEVEEVRWRWFYLHALLAAASPLLLPFLAGGARGLRERDPVALWFAAGLVFLMLLSSRKAAYLLPLMTPAALLTARYLSRLHEFREGRPLAWAQLVINLLLIAALFGMALAWRDHLFWGAAGVGLLLLAAMLSLLHSAWSARPSAAGLAASAVLITTFWNGVLLTHLPEDRTLYNLSRYLNEHVPAGAALYRQGDVDPRLAFYIDRLPAPLGEDEQAKAASFAWLLRHSPLPAAAKPGWEPVLQTQSRNGRRLYLYRRQADREERSAAGGGSSP